MHVEHYYESNINWVRGKRGVLFSPDLNDEIQVATPPQFDGGEERIWSPEHLFTAAVNSCYMTTFLAIAANSGLEFVRFSSRTLGKLEMVDKKYQMSEVTLMPTLVVKDDAAARRAQKVLEKAHEACLITNSINSRVVFLPDVVVA